MKPLVSVVVTAYNVGRYIEKAIHSLIGQTYEKMEIVIVNDGSIDDTKDICHELARKDKRIKLINKANEGLPMARGTGVTVARGEYVCFVDGDDWVGEQYISSLVGGLDICADADVVVGEYVIDENDSVRKLFEQREPMMLNRGDALLEMFKGKYFNWTTVAKLYRKNLLSTNVDWKKINSYGEDTATNWSIFNRANKVVYVPAENYHYVMRHDSMMHLSFSLGKMKYIDLYEKIFLGSSNALKNIIANMLIDSAVSYLFDFVRSDEQSAYEYDKYYGKLRKYVYEYNIAVPEKLFFKYSLLSKTLEQSRKKWQSVLDNVKNGYFNLREKLSKDKGEVYIYGTGKASEYISDLMIKQHLAIKGYLVSRKKTDKFRGMPVYEFSEMINSNKNFGIVLGLGQKNAHSVMRQIESLGHDDIAVCWPKVCQIFG